MSGGLYGRGKAPERALLALEEWPETDRAIWQAALAPVDPFADSCGERANFRAASNKRLECSYGRWLTFLHEFRLFDHAVSPDQRITPENVARYVQHLQELKNIPSTIALRLTDLVLMAGLFKSDSNWSFIRRLAKKVRALPKPKSEKHNKLVSTTELLNLGLKLIEEARQQELEVKAATLHRDGLIIALLALVPLRRRNFVQLRLGHEMQKTAGGWKIVLDAASTKTHQAREDNWPEILEPALEAYIAQHRPVLMNRKYRWHSRAGEHLWVASTGSALTQMALYDIVRKRTLAEFGTPINPHAFRAAAATTLAVKVPHLVHIAASVLGHRSLKSTEKFYNMAQGIDAHRRYNTNLQRFRNPGRRIKK